MGAPEGTKLSITRHMPCSLATARRWSCTYAVKSKASFDVHGRQRWVAANASDAESAELSVSNSTPNVQYTPHALALQEHMLFMESGRNWQAVNSFYQRLIRGELPLEALGLPGQRGKQSKCSQGQGDGASASTEQPAKGRARPSMRYTYKVHVNYDGTAFNGWSEQPGLDTVQGALAQALAPLVARQEQPKHRKGKGGAQTPSNHKQTLSAEVTESIRPSGSLDSTSSPAAGDGVSASSTTSDMAGVGATASRAYTGHSVTVMCAGRTDRGVSAHGMIISFWSWNQLSTQQVIDAINEARPGKLTASRVEEVPRAYHATFAAQWRRYVYLLPLHSAGSQQQVSCYASTQADTNSSTMQAGEGTRDHADADGSLALHVNAVSHTAHSLHAAAGSEGFDPAMVHGMLQRLVGRSLNYTAFARDTPPGKDCTCILHHASAHVVTLPAALPPTLTALDTHLFQPSRPTGSKQLQLGHHSHGRAGGPADEVGDARGSSETLPNKLTSDLSRRRSGGASERPVHALCIELVGDRFLRKQVRVLVSTAVRAARLDHHMHGDGPLFDHPEADPWVSQAAEVDMPMQDAALEHYVSVGLNRASTAAPAPPQGLCFAGAGEETWPAS